jgi:hypothetical protein
MGKSHMRASNLAASEQKNKTGKRVLRALYQIKWVITQACFQPCSILVANKKSIKKWANRTRVLPALEANKMRNHTSALLALQHLGGKKQKQKRGKSHTCASGLGSK